MEINHRDVLRIYRQLNGRTLISWIEKGLFKPLYEPENRGGKRSYSYQNLVEIGIIKELSLLGFPIKRIKVVMEHDSIRNRINSEDYDFFLLISINNVNILNAESMKKVGTTSFMPLVQDVPAEKVDSGVVLSGHRGVWVDVRSIRQLVDEDLG
ncbi:hypothetical protein DSCW_35570 [Desulfosarcina widdelii]|uniref:HTH merR-type domain-containing protein n=1 Tax=Desulfosarcina widdelii TaxID=947919 RepID=A0A5K7Z5X5_9BACT|nr:MerR family transcriptional regulator [Desulfosarcina widdelii]BBO76140.1 hypothetical protein DSCW_35570 [Desulfosarcina widdelii]